MACRAKPGLFYKAVARAKPSHRWVILSRSQHASAHLILPKGQTDIDGEVIWLNQCTLTQRDLEFWKLVKTEYRAGGIMLPNTIGYAGSCSDCQQHNLQCAANEVKLERGYCLCMWRVDGA